MYVFSDYPVMVKCKMSYVSYPNPTYQPSSWFNFDTFIFKPSLTFFISASNSSWSNEIFI
jgi:hypothetical protein